MGNNSTNILNKLQSATSDVSQNIPEQNTKTGGFIQEPIDIDNKGYKTSKPLLDAKLWEYDYDLDNVPIEEKSKKISFLDKQLFEKYNWDACSDYKFFKKAAELLLYFDMSLTKNKVFKRRLKNIILCNILYIEDNSLIVDDYNKKIKKIRLLEDLGYINSDEFQICEKELLECLRQNDLQSVF